jgi:hypothetical protein
VTELDPHKMLRFLAFPYVPDLLPGPMFKGPDGWGPMQMAANAVRQLGSGRDVGAALPLLPGPRGSHLTSVASLRRDLRVALRPWQVLHRGPLRERVDPAHHLSHGPRERVIGPPPPDFNGGARIDA